MFAANYRAYITGWTGRLLLGAALFVSPVVPGVARAQDSTVKEEPLAVVEVDFGQFAKSNLGKLLLEAGMTLAAKEMEKDPQETMAAVIESLGFDPMEQEIRLRCAIMNPENPLDGMTMDATLKDSTGNLQGLMLVAPEYQSQSYGDYTINSMQMGSDSIFVVFLDGASGGKQIKVATSEAAMKASLDSLKNGASSESVAGGLPEGEFLNVRLASLPDEFADEPPLSTIGEMLAQCNISLGEADDDLAVKIKLAAKTEEQATNLQQLAQGAVAMLALFKDDIREELGDEDFAGQLIPVLDQIEVKKEANLIVIETKIPQKLVVKFLREEADLPL